MSLTKVIHNGVRLRSFGSFPGRPPVRRSPVFVSDIGVSVFASFFWLVSSAQAASSCVVLQYHHFSEHAPRVTSVTPARFDEHLDYLAQNNFTVLPLSKVVDALQRRHPLPDKCVSLTVDDAYDSVYTHAFPRVRARGWPMTIFVNTRAVDEKLSPYMSWDQLRHMADSGVEIGNHSHSHAHLVRRVHGENAADWERRVRTDIETARRRIKQETGKTTRLFAYPYGEYQPALNEIVRSLDLVGFGQQSGPAWAGADFAALPRFAMAAGYAELPGFRVKVNTLPMPLLDAQPSDPVVVIEEWRPRLRLVFESGDYRFGDLRCYANGSDDVALHWSVKEQRVLEVVPGGALQVGRNRYNCTMPASDAGRYHWYSHIWIRREADGGWYREQ